MIELLNNNLSLRLSNKRNSSNVSMMLTTCLTISRDQSSSRKKELSLSNMVDLGSHIRDWYT